MILLNSILIDISAGDLANGISVVMAQASEPR
jgi:hypothetical protein